MVRCMCLANLRPGFSTQQCVHILSYSIQFTSEEKENSLTRVDLRFRYRPSHQLNLFFVHDSLP